MIKTRYSVYGACPELSKELVLNLKFILRKVEGKEIRICFSYPQKFWFAFSLAA